MVGALGSDVDPVPRRAGFFVRLVRTISEPSPQIASELKRRHARFQSTLLFGLVAGAIVITTYFLPPLAEVGPSTVVGLTAAGALALVYILSRTRFVESASVLTVSIATAAVWTAALLNANAEMARLTAAFLSSTILLATLLLPPSWSAGVAAATISALALAHRFDPRFALQEIEGTLALVSLIAVVGTGMAVVRNRDLRLLEERTKRLETEEARYRELYDSAYEGILLLEGDSIVAANESASRILGRSREDVIGTSPLDFTTPEGRASVESALRTGVPNVLETDLLRGDGQRVRVELLGGRRAVHGRNAQVVALHDVTAKATQAKERDRSARKAAEVERVREVGEYKSRVLNLAFHELNTPLTALRLQVHLMRTNEPSAESLAKLDFLDRNLGRLSFLVTNLLDAARLDSQQLVFHRRHFVLGPVVADACNNLREVVAAARVDLVLHPMENLRVHADPARVKQVIVNLLSNAIRSTPPGGVVEVFAREGRGDTIVAVRDSGRGLDPDEVRGLFEPFGNAAAADFGGIGLGLYLARGIVEEHGGHIWCESAGRGKGATFAFTLPA